jgi:Flp pilus assembly protein TadB
MSNIFEKIGRLFPKKLIKSLADMLDMAGMLERAADMLGKVLLVGIVLALVSFPILILTENLVILYNETNMLLNIVATLVIVLVYLIVCLLAVSVAFYAYLLVMMDRRKRQLEEVLPDFLQLAAANVRAGLPIEQALWRAATPEFGVLSTEVQISVKKTFSGEPISNSLDYLAGRFNSKYLKRTISILKFGISSGGEIGEILERTGSDMRKMQMLYKEAGSSMVMYIIFISFAALIGAPLLFAISHKLIATLSAVWANIPATTSMSSFGAIAFSPPEITPAEFQLFSYVAITVITMFASFILAVVKTGSVKEGIRSLPLFVVAGWFFVWLFMMFVNLLFTNLFI